MTAGFFNAFYPLKMGLISPQKRPLKIEIFGVWVPEFEQAIGKTRRQRHYSEKAKQNETKSNKEKRFETSARGTFV